jgi:HD-GYP domain-containing protein (c-di-GMP phosphodiesterase class II)
MASKVRKIDVDGLRVGMYVSRLDRPWLETPFLFQGFIIRTDSDIEELRRYCEDVEIDIEQSDATLQSSLLPATTKVHANTSSSQSRPGNSIWQRIKRLFGLKKAESSYERAPGEIYQDKVTTADELAVARNVHSGALQQLMDVLGSIRCGEEIPMPKLALVVDSMVDSVLRNQTAMALLVRMQKTDEHAGAHSMASSIWALVFGRHLGLDRESLAAVGLGGLLLDIGKTKLPKELLNKQGELTDIEWKHIRSHVDHGLQIIREVGNIDQRVTDMVATHHERHDGTGYPKGLKGNQIPVFGRIGGIVDSYTAMTNDRPYAKTMSSYDAMREFKSLSDKHFQAEMVEQFIQAIGIFPAGTLVELNTGEVGVVINENKTSRLQPELALILDSNKQLIEGFKIIDLANQGTPSPMVWIDRGVDAGTYDIDPGEYFL